MINDREFSSPGEEFSPPAPEFASPGPEQDRSGREFGQLSGVSVPPKKRRRVPGFMFAAAAVVTVTVALSAPAPAAVEFLQPENFTAEYRAYLDSIMEACEAEDPLAVHRLGADPMADEFWYECMEPYVHEVVHRGFSYMIYYDGEEMTTEPAPGHPALYFWHGESTPEEVIERNTWQYFTQLTYYRDGGRRNRGTWGVYYNANYGVTSFSQENDLFFNIFLGEMTQAEDSELLYHRGIWQSYEPYGYGYDDVSPDTPQLQAELTGTFYNEMFTSENGTFFKVNYLENGIWTQHFRRGEVETKIVDGSIILNKHLELEPAEEPGLYKGMTVWSPDSMDGGRGWVNPNDPLTLEELLYHHPYTRTY